MKKQQGFTLIEVMIVVVIIAILASIAYPSYLEYVLRSNRTEGQALLSDAAARQERYFAQNHSYADTATKLGMSSDMSPNALYQLEISDIGATTYKLQATRQNSQTRDSKCGDLTLDHKGDRGRTGTASPASCWK